MVVVLQFVSWLADTKRALRCVLFLAMMLLSVAADCADEQAEEEEKLPDNFPEEEVIETDHSVKIDGKRLRYKARTGTIHLEDKKGKATAAIFFVAYEADRFGSNNSSRPITFSFNGGPGSSSVWLHLGVLGPRVVSLDQEGMPFAPPYQLKDNPFSLLDKTDLVFIDPVSTGYSRAVDPDKAEQFHHFERDIESVGEFIRLYLQRNQRWESPKFIIGESYGTVRAAGLADHLMQRHGVMFNGIMLVSSVLDFQTIFFSPGNDLPYVLYLPAYAASAWYHGRLSPELQKLGLEELLEQVEDFAKGEYAAALFQGLLLPQQEKQKIAAQVAAFTGLSPEYVDRAHLRVPLNYFAKELLAEDAKVIGRFDSRYTGLVQDQIVGSMEYDPSYTSISGVFSESLYHYISTELEYKSDLPYQILAKLSWDWSDRYANRYVTVARDLARTMTRNPHLKVHVSSGYYDLATPYYAADYVINHLQIDPSLRQNITVDTYAAGHMMYLHEPSLKKQKADLADFIERAANPNSAPNTRQ